MENISLTKKEDYIALRTKRNVLRDQYLQTTSWKETCKLKNKIKEIDITLSEYELHNNEKH